MKIAIIGTGFCGLSLAWKLQQLPSYEITLFDKEGIGRGASGIAAGLLHPFAGLRATCNWMGQEGFSETVKLLNQAASYSKRPFISETGLFRPAANDSLLNDYMESARRYPGNSWWDEAQVSALLPHLDRLPGLYIRQAISVDCEEYLQALWRGLESRGAKFEKRTIQSTSDIKGFDLKIIAAGSGVDSIQESKKLHVGKVKGQILKVSCPQAQMPRIPINAQSYIVPQGEHLIIGATFERSWGSSEVDLDAAKKELLPKVRAFSEFYSQLPIVQVKASFRSTTRSHRPYITRLEPDLWAIGGFGSKGLLYHALVASTFADAIENGDLERITPFALK